VRNVELELELHGRTLS